MNLGAMLEVAIGIIFVWIVLSLTTIQFQEWISTLLDKRAKDMEFAIREMLANENLNAQFYDHPVIRGLTAKKRKHSSRTPAWFYHHPLVRGFTKEKRELPSYIPSQQFALSLFDIALTAGTESSLIQQGILKIRNDLQNDRKMTVEKAIIEELNLLSEFAHSAAATEAGTAVTKIDLRVLKDKVDEFLAKYSNKYPQLQTDINNALDKAISLKSEVDDVLKRQPISADLVLPIVQQSLDLLRVEVAEFSKGHPKLKDLVEAVQTRTTSLQGEIDDFLNVQPKSTDLILSKVRRGLNLLLAEVKQFSTDHPNLKDLVEAVRTEATSLKGEIDGILNKQAIATDLARSLVRRELDSLQAVAEAHSKDHTEHKPLMGALLAKATSLKREIDDVLNKQPKNTDLALVILQRGYRSLIAGLDAYSKDHPELKELAAVMRIQAARLKGEIDDVMNEQPLSTDLALSRVRRGVAALSVISPEVNQTLSALLMNVEDYVTDKERALAKARGNVEKWFDDAMDQVSGVFKRDSQKMALRIGFLIAMLLNVDSIGLTIYLWREPSVRAVLATKAQEFDLSISAPAADGQNNSYQAMQDFREQFTGINLPIGWTLKDIEDPIFQEPGSGCKLFPQGNDFFGLPLFEYDITNFIGPLHNKCLTPSQPDHSTNILIKLLGIVITAIAARQGAPFWFDILKRAVNLRGTEVRPTENAGK